MKYVWRLPPKSLLNGNQEFFFFKYKPTRPKKMGKKITVGVSKFMENGEQMLIDWAEQTRLKDRDLHRETN